MQPKRLFSSAVIVSALLVPSTGMAGNHGPSVTPPPSSGLSCATTSPHPANINELSDVDSGAFFDFIEVKILQNSTDIAGWKLCTAKDGKDPACAELGVGDGNWSDGSQAGKDDSSSLGPGSTTFQSDTWITYSDEDIKDLRAAATRGEVILVDAAGDVLDHIAYSRNGSCTDQDYWDVSASCSTCLTLDKSSNNKVIARKNPDGEGGWVDTGEDPTPGTDNDGGAGGGADHYAISHDGQAVTCQAEQITITAHDSADLAVDPGAVTLSLSTSTGGGKWATVVSGSGTLSGNSAFDGSASYQFPGNGETAVTLAFNYPLVATDPEVVNVNVTDGSVSELGAEDPNLSVALTGFLFSTVPTQIAGKDSDQGWNAGLLEVQAVRASDSDPSVCVALFSGAVTVELGAECRNPTSCSQALSLAADDGSLATAANPASTIATNADNGDILTSAYTGVSLNFDASARAYYAINYPDAGLMQMHARYELPDENGLPSGQYMSGSSNDLVVRPFALGFTNIDDGGAPAITNPGGVAPAGTGFITAASPFQFDLGGYRYADGEDSDADGVADAGANVTDNGLTANFSASAVLSLGAITPTSGANGSLSGGPVAISAGSAIDQSASYNEVGSLTIAALVGNYLGAADADIEGTSPIIGRFYPAQLVLLGGSSSQGGCNNFSYMDAPSLSVDFTVEARNVVGARTQHYDQTLMGGAVNLATIDPHAENNGDGVDRGSRLAGLAGVWSAGRYSVSSGGASFARDASVDGPFDDLQLSLSATDPLPEALALSGAVGSPPVVEVGTPVQLRYGRLAAENAFGPETEPLGQALRVEYFDGSGFVVNSLDDCSEVDFNRVQMNSTLLDPMPAAIALDSGVGSSTPSFGTSLGTGFLITGGDAGLSYSAPGAGNSGAITLEVDLSTLGWLQFDWDDNGVADTVMRPATVTFGRYRGNDRIIFWEENFTR